MIHLAMQSSCKLAIFPLQDVFEQGTEARMNQPSQLDGNWSYRFDGEWSREVAEALRMAAQTAGRLT
jgi:4-alpha-glucanotransferase